MDGAVAAKKVVRAELSTLAHYCKRENADSPATVNPKDFGSVLSAASRIRMY